MPQKRMYKAWLRSSSSSSSSSSLLLLLSCVTFCDLWEPPDAHWSFGEIFATPHLSDYFLINLRSVKNFAILTSFCWRLCIAVSNMSTCFVFMHHIGGTWMWCSSSSTVWPLHYSHSIWIPLSFMSASLDSSQWLPISKWTQNNGGRQTKCRYGCFAYFPILRNLVLLGKLMANLMKQATALGVEDNVIWLDHFVPTQELMNVIKCTSIYLTPFDESTPTSVSLECKKLHMWDCWMRPQISMPGKESWKTCNSS